MIKTKLITCLAWILLMGIGFAILTPTDPVPLITLGKSTLPIKIDGKFNEWGHTATISGFTLNDGIGYATVQTRVYLTYDDNSLYVAYCCDEPEMAKIESKPRKHDDWVWQDESVELIAMPNNNPDKLVHFVINHQGVSYDALGMDPENGEWESGIVSAGGKFKNGWFVEMTIPLKSILDTSSLSDTLKINFYRSRYLGKNPVYSSWSYCPGLFKNPTRLGELTFGATVPTLLLSDRIYSSDTVTGKPDFAIGDHQVSYHFISQDKGKPKYQLLIEGIYPGKTKPLTTIEMNKPDIRKEVHFNLAGIEKGIQVRMTDNKNQTIFKHVYPLIQQDSFVGALSYQLDQTQAMLKNKSLPSSLEQELQAAILSAQSTLQTIQHPVNRSKSLSTDELQVLSQQIKTLYNQLHEKQVILWQTPITDNIVPEKLPADGKEVHSIQVTAMRDEYTSAVFNLSNLSEKYYTGRITLTMQDGLDGIFPRNNITLRKVVFRELRDGKVYGDVLPKMDEANLLEVPPMKTGQVWLSIHTPDNLKGTFTGILQIKPLDESFPTKEITLKITVLPLLLPKTMPIATYLWDYGQTDEYVRDMRDHKINHFLVNCYLCPPICNDQGDILSIDFRKHDAALALKHKYGDPVMYSYGVVREFDLITAKKHHWEYMSDPWKKAFSSWFTQWIQHIKSLGLTYNDFSMQIWDEATGDSAKKVAQVGPFLRSLDPNVKWVMDGAQTLEEARLMDPYVDIWIPHLDNFMKIRGWDQLLAFYKSTGKPVWCYTCRINMTGQPVLEYYRLKPWYAWRNGFDGVCFWDYNSWRGDPWSDFDLLGDEGYSDNGVVYTGDSGPITSRRWEMFREGLQDYQYLYMLKSYILNIQTNDDPAQFKFKNNANVFLEIAVNDVLTSKDEAVLLKYRAEIQKMILKLASEIHYL